MPGITQLLPFQVCPEGQAQLLVDVFQVCPPVQAATQLLPFQFGTEDGHEHELPFQVCPPVQVGVYAHQTSALVPADTVTEALEPAYQFPSPPPVAATAWETLYPAGMLDDTVYVPGGVLM